MENLLEKNLAYLFSRKIFFSHSVLLQKLVEALNKDKIAIISGMRYSWKTKFLHDMLEKTGAKNEVFYYNGEIDTLSRVKDIQDLKVLVKLHKRIHGAPKIIALQNISKIRWIKDYIGELYTEKKYKIVILENNIKIGGVQEIEIFPISIEKLWEEKIPNILKYGNIEEVQLVRDLYFKDFLLTSITEHIISQDAIHTYDIKSKTLYQSVLAYLAKINNNISLRELQRELESEGISIALMTLSDYIDAGIRSKILKKVTKYDIKAQKEIPTKVTYYFGDTGIRNSLLGNIYNHELATKNVLQNELEKKRYTVYSGVNGRFEMTFRAVKWRSHISIHYHWSPDKNELKKNARKLSKLHDDSKKFLVVKDKSMYNLRKQLIDDVMIVELHEIIPYI